MANRWDEAADVKTLAERHIVGQLTAHMWACKRLGLSFADCMAEARKQFNREVSEAALSKPMPE